MNMTKGSLGGMALESSSYVQQFKDAMNVNGGDIEGATLLDYILHFFTFGWKVDYVIENDYMYWYKLSCKRRKYRTVVEIPFPGCLV